MTWDDISTSDCHHFLPTPALVSARSFLRVYTSISMTLAKESNHFLTKPVVANKLDFVADCMLMASRCSTIHLRSAVLVAFCQGRHMWLPGVWRSWKQQGKKVSQDHKLRLLRPLQPTSLNSDAFGKIPRLVNGASSHIRDVV